MNRKEFYKAVADYEKDQLMHHGIQGQKWGIKHGPPYPIDGSGLTTISKGSILHRVSGNIDDDKATGHAYVTYGDDAKRYSGKFSYGRNWTNKDVYDQTYKVKKDMKGPSKEERVATFKEMYENDPDFKEAMKRAESEYKIKIPDEYESKENFTKLYKLFTKAIGSKDAYIRDTYFKILKDKGYDFVQDDLDTGLKMGTYPTIIFDRQECMEFVSRKRIGMLQAAKNWYKYGGKVKHSADIYATSLSHYGIAGQKWGRRRWQYKDGSLTPEGYPHYGYNGPREAGSSDSTNKKKSKKSSENSAEKVRNDKAEKVGWAKDHKLVNFIPVTNLIGMTVDETKSIARNITYNNERKKSKTDPKTGLLLKNDNSLSMKDDAKRVNPNYGRAIQGTINYSSNCQFCTMSYDLRRRGYEVQAGKRKDGGSKEWFAGMYKPPAEYTTFLAKDLRSQEKLGKKNRHYTDAVNDEIRKQGDGARGQVSFGWDKWSGHSIAYEVKDGKVNYIDAQNGKMFNEKNFKNYVKHADNYVAVCRLDNIEPDISAMKDSGVVRLDKKEKKGKGKSK